MKVAHLIPMLRVFFVVLLLTAQASFNAAYATADESLGTPQVLERAVNAAGFIKNKRDKAQALHRIALVQIKAGQLSSAKKTLSEALAVTMSMTSIGWKDEIFGMVAVAQAISGESTEAIRTMSKVSNRNRRHDGLWSILVWQAESGNFAEALRIALSVDESEFLNSNLVAIAWVQAKSRDVEGALKTAAEIKDTGYRNQVIGDIAVEQAKIGEVDSVIKNISKINDGSIRTNSLRIIVRDLARAGDVRRGKEVASKFESNSPNYAIAEALSELGEAQVKLGDEKGAMETIGRVSEEFLHDALSRVAEAQARSGNIPGGMETSNLIKNEPQRMQAQFRIATALAETENPTEAAKLLSSLDVDPEARVALLSDIAVSQIKTGDMAEARNIVVEVVAANLSTDAPVIALKAIGIAFVKAGKLSDAMKTIESIDGLMHRSQTLHEIARTQAETGDYPGAWKTAGTIQEKFAKLWAIHGIAVAQARSGDLRSAVTRSEKLAVPYERAQALLGVAEGVLEERSSIKK